MNNENTIRFMAEPTREVMRITKDGIFVPDDVAVDEAAEGVIAALEDHIRGLVERAVKAERQACAKLADEQATAYAQLQDFHGIDAAESIADAIRARGQQ